MKGSFETLPRIRKAFKQMQRSINLEWKSFTQNLHEFEETYFMWYSLKLKTMFLITVNVSNYCKDNKAP